MIVMKFGGASLADNACIQKTCTIVKEYQSQDSLVLVVSAMKGATDQLFSVVELIKHKNLRSALKVLDTIKDNHFKTLEIINPRHAGVKVKIELLRLFILLEHFIRNVVPRGMTPPRTDYIVSFGERWSCRLIAEALESNGVLAYPLDASHLLATNDAFGDAEPLARQSQEQFNLILYPLVKNNITPVVTGYIGFAPDGCTTTLGRGGSDLSAAFLATFLNAQSLYLWKDVDGFYTTDPHKDMKARLYAKLSYRQAEEMAKNGAKVIYYKAIKPVEGKRIPIYIKSFLKPKMEGTVIK